MGDLVHRQDRARLYILQKYEYFSTANNSDVQIVCPNSDLAPLPPREIRINPETEV